MAWWELVVFGAGIGLIGYGGGVGRPVIAVVGMGMLVSVGIALLVH
jgi:hypothetical protein